jgi:RecA/RadA recombinase
MAENSVEEANHAAVVPKATAAVKPKKEEKPAKRLSLRETIAKKIRASAPKKKDGGSVELSSTNKTILSKVKYVLTTGIQPFDDLVGAFPFGRVTEVFGLESCGKTQLMIRAAVRAQTLNVSEVVRKNGEVKLVPVNKKKVEIYILYVDNEQSIDDDEKLVQDGVELNVELLRCDTIDQLFKSVELAIDEVAVWQKEDPDTLYLCVIAVDTIASTSSSSEITQDWGKVDYSRHAQQYRRGFRIMTRKINRVNVALICTNQCGDTFKDQGGGKKKMMRGGGLQPDDYATFGGRALKYYATHRVFMQKMRDYKVNPKSKFANGMLIGFKSVKNRVRKPFREGRMVILFGDGEGKGGGFSNEFSILETLIYLKYAEIQDGGKEIKFKFKKFGIPTTTFGDAGKENEKTSTTLDEDDDQQVSSKRGSKDPYIEIRAEWSGFYADHKADIDALYAAAIAKAFADESVPSEDDEDEEEEEEEFNEE